MHPIILTPPYAGFLACYWIGVRLRANPPQPLKLGLDLTAAIPFPHRLCVVFRVQSLVSGSVSIFKRFLIFLWVQDSKIGLYTEENKS